MRHDAIKAERLVLFAQKIAEQTPGFFEVKGPGRGDRAALQFMRNLRDLAMRSFGRDYSERKVCEGADLRVDFYFPDEESAIEVALSLHQNLTEYERDIFKCLLARDSGLGMKRLIFIGKPGASLKQGAPAPRAIADWVRKNFELEIQILELRPKPRGR